MIRYLDVCSGYSAFTQGAAGLGFECAGYAEIDAFSAALLGHHYGASRPRYMPDPDAEGIDARERETRIRLAKSMRSLADSHFGNRIVNFGDFTQIREDDVGPVDGLVGGTPCQAFSVAGKRLGLDDPRGNLTLEFLALARRVRASWLAWENVPGFLSHDEGRTMGTFLGLLGELGYGWAYRVLDAQYIRVDGLARAVPQRRKRLIVVGYLGDAARAAAVLFDRESLRGDPAPRRETGQGTTHPVAQSIVSSGRGVERSGETRGQDPVVAVAFGGNNTAGPIDIATARNAHGGPHGRLDFESETFVAHALRAEGFDASEDGTGRGTPLIPVYAIQERAVSENPGAGPQGMGVQADVAQPLMAGGPVGGNQGGDYVAEQWAVRRLTPRECERLMGLEDDFTLVPYRGKPAVDGPRYKVLGNSQARNMMRWIAHGIADVSRAGRAVMTPLEKMRGGRC